MSPVKHSYGSVTDRRTDRQTDDGQSDPCVSLCFAGDTIKIVAAFLGMHVSPAKHSYGSVTDGQTDRRTDDGQSDPCVSLCFAGDTKIQQHNYANMTKVCKSCRMNGIYNVSNGEILVISSLQQCGSCTR